MIIPHQTGKMAYEVCWHEYIDVGTGIAKKVVKCGVYNFSTKMEAEKAAASAKLINKKAYFVRQHNAR